MLRPSIPTAVSAPKPHPQQSFQGGITAIKWLLSASLVLGCGADFATGDGDDSALEKGTLATEASAVTAAASTRPNVIVILLDDLGYSDFGSYGGEIRTPNVDALAAGGTRFRNYYVTPRCSPTRISLLTGVYTQQAATAPGESLPPLRTDNNVTVPEVLHDAGYRTYMAGKWHLGNTDGQLPRARGFDHVFGIGPKQGGAGANKWKKGDYSFWSKNSEIPARAYGDGAKAFYQATAIGDYALDFLTHNASKADDKPFFMYLAFNSPHFPIQADSALITSAPAGQPTYLSLYADGWGVTRNARYSRMLSQGVIDSTFGLSPKEPFMTPTQNIPVWTNQSAAQRADLTRKMALYAASVQSVDAAVGRVVARLKATGQFDNTLIIVQSDNGGNYEGGVVGNAFNSAAPLTGQQLTDMGQPAQVDDVKVGGGWAWTQTTPFRFFKHYTHGGGVRSPLVVSWPAHTATPGSWTNQVAHVIDVAPTILEAAGVAHPTQFGGHAVLPLEGKSFVGTVANGTAPTARKLGFEHETNRAFIDGNYKLVVRHENADKPELYDLSSDPSELHDLATAQPTRRATLVTEWNNWATRVGVPAARQLP